MAQTYNLNTPEAGANGLQINIILYSQGSSKANWATGTVIKTTKQKDITKNT